MLVFSFHVTKRPNPWNPQIFKPNNQQKVISPEEFGRNSFICRNLTCFVGHPMSCFRRVAASRAVLLLSSQIKLKLYNSQCFKAALQKNHEVIVYILISSFLMAAFNRLELCNIIVYILRQYKQSSRWDLLYIYYVLFYASILIKLDIVIKYSTSFKGSAQYYSLHFECWVQLSFAILYIASYTVCMQVK